MNVGQMIDEARFLSGCEETGMLSADAVARVLTTKYRDLMGFVTAKYKLRYTGEMDFDLTADTLDLPDEIVTIAKVENRTGIDTPDEGLEIIRIDDQEQSRQGYVESWGPQVHRIRLRGYTSTGMTIRVYYDLDVEKLDATATEQVPRLVPPMHHQALTYGAAVQLQRRTGNVDPVLAKDADDKFWAAVMAMGEPGTIWRR